MTHKFFNGLTLFEINNKDFYFVEFQSPDKVKCWEDKGNSMGTYMAECGWLPVEDIGKDNLEELHLWNKLSKEIQKRVIDKAEEKKNAIHKRMENARGKREKKYPNIPREIECIKCKKVTKVAPGQLAKKLDRDDLTIEKYVEEYQCQTCNPTKGRKPNPKFAGLPKELVCKCGNKTNLNPHQLSKKAEKLGTTIKKLIASYQCQTCNPTKGRKKKK